MIPKHNYLIIQALGENHHNIMSELTQSCLQCGCNILNSKTNIFGQELAVTLFLSGNWGAIAKMEAAVHVLEKKLGLTLFIRRTREFSPIGHSITYSAQVTAIDKPGILRGIIEFLTQSNIDIEEIAAQTYLAHNHTRMAFVELRLNIPDKVHLASLRDQFMTYCDDHNLDAFLEPYRGP